MSIMEVISHLSTSPGRSSTTTDGDPIADHGRAMHKVEVDLRYQQQSTELQLVFPARAPEEIAAPIDGDAGTRFQKQPVQRHELEQAAQQIFGGAGKGDLEESSASELRCRGQPARILRAHHEASA